MFLSDNEAMPRKVFVAMTNVTIRVYLVRFDLTVFDL